MVETYPLEGLVAECAARIRALPAPKNGQVRAVPDERTIRYYQTLGLLDRPCAMRGRTALYNARHVAQVVAIKRLQTMGRSLAEIQALWPSLDEATLARMSGVSLAGTTPSPAPGSLAEPFWKRAPTDAPTAAPTVAPTAAPSGTPTGTPTGTPSDAAPATLSISISIELSPGISLSLPMPSGGSLSHADVRALRAAAAPLLNELARRRLDPHARDVVGKEDA